MILVYSKTPELQLDSVAEADHPIHSESLPVDSVLRGGKGRGTLVLFGHG